MTSLWIGILAFMGVLAYPVAVLTAATACRASRARREPAAARWQDCDWCDPAGDEALTVEDCECTEPCGEPSARWCAAARPALRRQG